MARTGNVVAFDVRFHWLVESTSDSITVYPIMIPFCSDAGSDDQDNLTPVEVTEAVDKL